MTSAHLHPMGIGEILDGTLSLYRKHFGAMFATVLLPSLLTVPFNATVVRADSVGEAAFTATSLSMMFVFGIIGGIAALVALGALARQTSRAFLGAEVSIRDGVVTGWRRLVPLIGAVLLAALVLVAAFGVCFLVFGFLTARIGEISWGLGLLMALLGSIVTLIVMLRVGASLVLGVWQGIVDPEMSMTLTTGQIYLQQALTAMVGALTVPFTLGSMVLLYYDRRIRTEASDLEVATGMTAIGG